MEFWEYPPITENFVALKWSPAFLYVWEGLLIDVPPGSRQSYSSKEVRLCCCIVASVCLHAHLEFQTPIISGELETVESELWLQIFSVLYLREHSMEWLKSGLFILVIKGNKEPSCQEWHQFSYEQNAGMWTCFRKGDHFQGLKLGSWLMLGNELSETHVLTKQEILLGKGTQVESSRIVRGSTLTETAHPGQAP